MASWRQQWAAISSVQVAIGLMIVLLALFAGLFSYFIAVGVGQTQKQFEDHAASVSQSVATDAFWISELANQTLRRVDAALGPDLNTDPQSLQPALEGLSSVTDVYIVDANGQIKYSTITETSASVAGADYFTALRDGAAFYLSPLVIRRSTGDHVFLFGKRVERDGRFAGAIAVSFPEQLLSDLATNLQLEPGSTVSLVRDDGQLIGRYPPTDGPVDLNSLPLFTQYLPSRDAGTYTSAASPVDGIARVVGYRRVPGTRIVALAAVATSATWGAFNSAIMTVILISSPVVLGLLVGCFWIVKLLRRDAIRTQALEQSDALNTMLLREIHHRIKNNLQSVASLVRMQDMPQSSKRDLEGRLTAMTAMHEHIYKHDVYAQLDAHYFVPAVVNEVKAAYGATAEIAYRVDHLVLDRDHATPLALLLSELATNCFKYAFPSGATGHITIELTPSKEGRARLLFRDNGPGLAHPNADDTRSMGIRLVRGVVSQLRGTYSFRNEDGAVFEAEIALAPDHQPPIAT